MSTPNTYQLKLQEEIIKKVSFMNTTKWQKLFSIVKEIEWLFIPSIIQTERKNRDERLTPKTHTQNTKLIAKTLQVGTQFEYEESSEGIKIYGYK